MEVSPTKQEYHLQQRYRKHNSQCMQRRDVFSSIGRRDGGMDLQVYTVACIGKPYCSYSIEDIESNARPGGRSGAKADPRLRFGAYPIDMEAATRDMPLMELKLGN
ncbi:hypothetical protein H6P81_000520 [Aristolochia fimbriata]|uniref:Uncharacterized protein n=1 Tax=Aristolochia fimbriata TaxID=158543 RepID=A0AAV7F7N7_ARIFI|nr:hypothetical protein H6P81_000520 [Aristolochia fimbriata]